jgi:hypothetical protein
VSSYSLRFQSVIDMSKSVIVSRYVGFLLALSVFGYSGWFLGGFVGHLVGVSLHISSIVASFIIIKRDVSINKAHKGACVGTLTSVNMSQGKCGLESSVREAW